MSDNINFNKEKGTYSFVSHKEPAWHTLGKIVDDAMTSEEALVLANLDYTVELAKVQAVLNKYPKESPVVLPNYYATYRTDTNNIFGLVGSRYEVVQNTEAFKFMDSIVGEGKAIYETAGALGNGEVVFITAKLPYYIRINGDDVVNNYLVVSISHDGSAAVKIFLTPIRVVCQNTLALGISSAKFVNSLRHTKNVHNKIIDAYEVLSITKTITEKTQDLYKELTNIKVNDTKVKEYINNVLLSKDELQGLAIEKCNIEYSDIVSTRKKNIVKDVFKYYNIGVGQSNIIGTAFGAYNAITGYLSNVKNYSNDSKKMESLILGGVDNTLNFKAINLAKEVFV